MQTSNVVELCSVNQIEFPLEGKQITQYYTIIKEELTQILLAVHSIKVATRQDVRDLLLS